MAFPLSISGSVRVRGAHDPETMAKRVAHALMSETVEVVGRASNVVWFKCTMAMNIPRPGGGIWLFTAFDRGRIEFTSTRIRYRLSTAGMFGTIATMSMLLALPALVWPWPWLFLSIAGFAFLFGGNWIEKRIRFPLWLRKVALSEIPYIPRVLELATGAD